ncbi:FIST N-terminal domain-containing protein [Pelagicoccus sp. SDUM812002]|uniref:FIST signal transduction protein n=1 Tax=Pelagicoccus sp. SDUM812002 TaxID=3041266 RepID=UPI00280D0677|nr:FIST N-terminal domain-containing protein [Pelagicoccus sp. SDUM812002]MDQ8188003.1 FIST N-terminal domain-containing protein [Pelagicoccus sp. SDUM812002]
MPIKSSSSIAVSDLASGLAEVASQPGVASLLVLACDGNGYAAESVDPILKAQKLPVAGGVFPQIISGTTRMEKGFVIVGLSEPLQVETIPGLSVVEDGFEDRLESLDVDLSKTRTVMVFVDGLSTRINDLVEDLFAVFGLEANYIGGGAGSLSLEQRPCLFTNRGMVMDCAVLAFTNMQTGIGVSHGWQDLEGPFEVTESRRNTVVSLDWQPAYEVYRETVEAHAGNVFASKDFFEIASSYPFGISRLAAEKIVRDPVSLGPNNEIVCIGEVPQQAFVHILKGDPASLIAAAKEALRRGRDSFEGRVDRRAVFLVDCISRYLFLGAEFVRELEALSIDTKTPTFGVLSLGEIANNRKDYLEFYNKTAVVAVIEA